MIVVVAAAQAGVGAFYSSPTKRANRNRRIRHWSPLIIVHCPLSPTSTCTTFVQGTGRWRPDSRFLSNTTTTGADFTTCWPHIFIAFPYYQLHLILSRMRTKHEKEDGLVLGKIDGSRHSPAGFGPDSSYVRIAQRSCYQSIFKRLIIFSLFYFLFTFS